jgi:putative membrane protein
VWWFGGMWIFGFLWFLFIIAMVWLVVGGIARGVGRGHWNDHDHERGGRDQAMAILRERFARGEIDEVEYLERRHALQEDGKR